MKSNQSFQEDVPRFFLDGIKRKKMRFRKNDDGAIFV